MGLVHALPLQNRRYRCYNGAAYFVDHQRSSVAATVTSLFERHFSCDELLLPKRDFWRRYLCFEAECR